MDNYTLTAVIESSTLSPEDKDHWKSLLPALSHDQKSRLHHILTTKTEVVRAISLIQRALQIIADLEAEADIDAQKQSDYESEREKLIDEITAIRETEEKILSNEEELKSAEEDTVQKLEEMRAELSKLSQEVHGSPPPSYSSSSTSGNGGI